MDFPQSIEEAVERILEIELEIIPGTKFIYGGCTCPDHLPYSNLEVVEVTRTIKEHGWRTYIELSSDVSKNRDCADVQHYIFTIDFINKPCLSIDEYNTCCDCFMMDHHKDKCKCSHITCFTIDDAEKWQMCDYLKFIHHKDYLFKFYFTNFEEA